MKLQDDLFESDQDEELLIRTRERGAAPRTMKSISQTLSSEIVSSLYSFTFSQTTGSLLKTRLKAMKRSLTAFHHHTQSSTRDGMVAIDEYEPLDDSQVMNTFRSEKELDALLQYIEKTESGGSYSANCVLKQDGLEQLTEPYIDSIAISAPAPARPPSMFRRASSMVLSKSNSGVHMPLVGNPQPTRILSHPLETPAPNPWTEKRKEKSQADDLIVSPLIADVQSKQSISSSSIFRRGIATPLQYLPSKQAGRRALFTTSSVYPFPIKTLNDVACVYIGASKQSAYNTNFADSLALSYRKWFEVHLKAQEARGKILLCGQLTELNAALVSLWVEMPSPDVYVWVAEEIQDRNSSVRSLRKSSVSTISSDHSGYSETDSNESMSNGDHIYRISTSYATVVLQGADHLWTPPVIGCAILISPSTLRILDYNEAVLELLMGSATDLRGEYFDRLVPQFGKLWDGVQPCFEKFGGLVPGVVIPEHKFRSLVGTPIQSTAFVNPHPNAGADNSIKLVTHFGDLYVDMHLRVVESQLVSVWLSYSRESSHHHPIEHLMHDGTLEIVTPPRTPLRSPSLGANSNRYGEDYTELLDIKVGAHRRETKFSSFEEIKLLGRGGYGEVRLVKTPSKRHTVVLKSIYKDTILVDTWSRDRQLGTIPNEIRVLNQLRSSPHDHIVQMIDFFEDSRCYHIVMLPCKGPGVMDLFDFIETHGDAASHNHLLRIWEQIVSAVARIHSLGIVHRDLKDENVIMDARGSATLIDFGSSAYINQGPFDVFVGTIDYAAPEVVEGALYQGEAQDNWALGILLYTILYREPPFKSADEIVAAVLPNKEPGLAGDLIEKLLAKTPADRPTASQVLSYLSEKTNTHRLEVK